MFQNIPQVKLGIVAVSRDCFVISLSEKRRKAIVDSYTAAGGSIYEAKTTVENENDMKKALRRLQCPRGLFGKLRAGNSRDNARQIF